MVVQAEYVYNLPNQFVEKDCQVGVVLSLDRHHNQFHCGISFDLNKSVNIIHLEGHERLKYTTTWEDFKCYVKPNMHPFRQEAFIALCHVIKDRILQGDTKIPYGFIYDEYASYDQDGTLHLAEHETGLTCATYVMTVFHSAGIDLIDIPSWTVRPDDSNWQGSIKHWHFRNKHDVHISKEQLAHLKYETGCPRFRPEEVAVSSALYTNAAASTTDIRAAGAMLNRYMYEMDDNNINNIENTGIK